MELLILNGLVNGLIVGGIYALVGVSLTLLYGVLRVVNFAHGEFVIAGSFLAFVLFSSFGVPPLLAVPIAAVAFFAAGWGLYGVSIAAAALMLLLFEADSRTIDYTFTPVSMQVGPIYVSTARLVALAITVVVSIALALFLFKTLPGKALRAAIMNPEAIQIMGVDIVRLSAFAFALASALAGVTGVLIALVFPAFNPFSGAEYTIIAFIVVVLGGLGNPVGALLAGVLFGLAEQMATVFLPQAMAQIVGFLILVGTIFFRPSGILGVRFKR
jgi:branched-chain amino acid transport system permease protein